MNIDSLYTEADAAQAVWLELFGLLTTGSVDFERPRPTFSNSSLTEFRRRGDLAFELLFGTRPADATDATVLVLESREADIRPQVQALTTNAEDAASQIRSNWREGASIRDTNDTFAFQFVDSEGVGYANVELGPQFKQIRLAVNQLMATLGSVVPLCKAGSISDLSKRAEALGQTARQADVFRQQAEQSARSTKSHSQKAEQSERAARDVVVQAEAVAAAIRELQQRATTDSSSVATLVEQIKTIGSAATALEAQVDTYRAKFEAFQVELDGRSKEFVQFQSNAKAAVQENVAREVEIDRLSKLADAMIDLGFHDLGSGQQSGGNACALRGAHECSAELVHRFGGPPCSVRTPTGCTPPAGLHG